MLSPLYIQYCLTCSRSSLYAPLWLPFWVKLITLFKFHPRWFTSIPLLASIFFINIFWIRYKRWSSYTCNHSQGTQDSIDTDGRNLAQKDRKRFSTCSLKVSWCFSMVILMYSLSQGLISFSIGDQFSFCTLTSFVGMFRHAFLWYHSTCILVTTVSKMFDISFSCLSPSKILDHN